MRSRLCKFASLCGPRTSLLLLLLSFLLLQFGNRADAQTQKPSPSPLSPGQGNIVQDRQEGTTLELGKPGEREIAGGQSHNYRINLAAGQYVKTKIEQRGIDVVLRISGPDGKSLAEYDAEVRLSGEENAEFVAGPAGAYTLNVAAKYRHVPVARYQIQMVELRDATEKDRLSQQRREQIARVTKLYFAGKYDEALLLADGLVGELEKADERTTRTFSWSSTTSVSSTKRKGIT